MKKHSKVKLNPREGMGHKLVIKPPSHEIDPKLAATDQVGKAALQSHRVELLSPWMSHEQ